MTLSALGIEEQYGQFDQEFCLEYCLALTGRKADLSIEPILERWAHLFTPEAIQAVGQAEARGTRHERRRWRRMALALTDKYIMRHVAAVEEELHAARRTVAVEVDGKDVSLIQMQQLVSVEPDAKRRHLLNDAWRGVQLREISPIGLRLWQARQQAARNLGYRSYAAVYLRLKEMDRRATEQRARAVLTGTKFAYLGAIAEALPRYAGVNPSQAIDVDVAYALHAGMASTTLQLNPVAAVRATLRGIGLDLDKVPGLELDLEPRPDKAPRAMCFPIDSPRRQVVCCKPQGRYQDVISLMHEMGHALHAAYMDPSLPVPLRTVWERGTTEACAYLLEYLATDADWMVQVLGMDRVEAGRLARLGELRQLYLARKSAGQALYDFDLDANPTETAAQAYVNRLEEATGLVSHPAPYSLGDDELYAAGYLEAFELHHHLRYGVRRQCPDDWWQCPEAGEWLRSKIWRRGMAWNAQEFIAACGSPATLKSGWFSA